MKMTESAALAVQHAMRKGGLDTNEYEIYFDFVNGAMAFEFTKDAKGKHFDFNGLKVTVSDRLDTEGVLVDFREFNGKQGIVFTGEEDGD